MGNKRRVHTKVTNLISKIENTSTDLKNNESLYQLYVEILELVHVVETSKPNACTDIIKNINKQAYSLVDTQGKNLSKEDTKNLLDSLKALELVLSPDKKIINMDSTHFKSNPGKVIKKSDKRKDDSPSKDNNESVTSEADKDKSEVKSSNEPKKLSNTQKMPSISVETEVLSAKSLASTKNETSESPYVVVQVGNKKYKTKVIQRTSNPSWRFESSQEIFNFRPSHISKSKTPELVFKIMGHEKYKVDTRLGMVRINLLTLQEGKQYDEWCQIKPQKSGDITKGDLHVRYRIYTDQQSKNELRSPLWYAVANCNLDQVCELLKENKDIDWNERGEAGITLLHLAVQTFSEDSPIIILELLKHDCDVNLVDDIGVTPFHEFCRSFKSPDCKEIFQKYLSKGAKINQANFSGETPLHFAILNNSLKLILVDLLLRNGADPNICSEKCDSPIFYAVHLGREDLVKTLIAHGSDCDLVSKEGKSLVDLSISLGYEDMAESIKDSLHLRSWLFERGFEEFLKKFLEKDIYLYVLPNLSQKILSKLIKDPVIREQITEAAKTIPVSQSGRRKETVNRNVIRNEKETEFEERLKTTLNEKSNIKDDWVIKIDDLEFVQLLGKGNYGEVYKGFYKLKPVAIKIFKVGENPKKQIEEFKKEFSILVKVHSPHTVNFYGATLRKKLSIVMECCKHGSLHSVLRDLNVEITWERLISWITDIVKAIQYLHSFQPPVMHRDLKTHNVLVTHDWQCKVCDFGLSRFDTPSNLSTLSRTRGTYEYIAPELGKFGDTHQRYTKKADIYSVAIILWELVNCVLKGSYEEPYQEYNFHPYRVFYSAANTGLRPTLSPDCPEIVSNLIKSCWDDNPDKRPETNEILKQLELINEQYQSNIETWSKWRRKKKT